MPALQGADAPAEQEPIVTTDLLRIRTVTGIDVAADGSAAVYAVQSIAEKTAATTDEDGWFKPAEYEYRSHLFLLDLEDPDAPPLQLTRGDRSDSSPVFSPDGETIAFVRSGEERERPASENPNEESQIWLLSRAGGEAWQLTNFKHGAANPVWSRNGDAIIVTSNLPADELEGSPTWDIERPGRAWGDHLPGEEEVVEPKPAGTRAEIRAWLEANSRLESPAAISRLNFQDEITLREPYRFSQLFLLDPGATAPIAAEAALQLTRGFYDHTQPAFLPDNQRIVYVARKDPAIHPDRLRGTDLWLINRDGSGDRVFLARDGWSFRSPRPSLDGSVVAFIAQQMDEPTYRQSVLGLIGVRNADTENPVLLTEHYDRSISSFEWMTARGALLFTAADRGAVALLTMNPGLIEPAEVVAGPVGVQSFDVGNGAIVYAEHSPMNPCVLKARTPQHGEWVAHDLNEWVNRKRLSFPVPGWITRPDGTRVQYWVMAPTNLEEGRTYPLCLEMHGGPSAMWGPGEDTMWLEFQLLCSWGYGVVYCNPRGSGGYGYEFQKANHQNWGPGPAGDVLAAVDHAINEDWVDPDRLTIAGGSYAGYLTAWVIAHDHRFKAAVAQRGVYDLGTFFGEGNAWRLVEYAMGGFPWETTARPVLQRESPFTYVRQIRTPLLIMHASKDLRTGVSQSEMLYRALKVLERPVEYIRYPDAGHDLSRSGDPRQRMDRLNRIIEFFDRYTSNDHPPPIAGQPADEPETVEMMPVLPRGPSSETGGE